MKIYICNASELSILSLLDRAEQKWTPVGYAPQAWNLEAVARVLRPIEEPAFWLARLNRSIADIYKPVEIISATGDADTARLFSQILNRPVEPNRITVKLEGGPEIGSLALIGQYTGPRLPEGATTLPEGAKIEWWVL